MATSIVDHQLSTTIPLAGPSEPEVRERVWRLLSNLYPVTPLVHRRTEQRYPFACLALVTPLEDDSVTPAGSPIVVATKNISESGVSFYHPSTLPYRRVVLKFDRNDQSSISFLVDLSWCRFTRQGWYESGGRLLQVFEPVRGAATGS